MLMELTKYGILQPHLILTMITRLFAPSILAASTIEYGISDKDSSINLASKGIAQIVSGTIIAVVPIEVPTMNRVTGKRNTTNNMNGTALPISMILFKIKFNVLFGNKPPGRVSLTSVPRGSAINQEIIRETNDI